MADVLDLYNDDYDRFVDHCIGCSGTLAIKQFVDGKIKKYLADNDDIVTCLMERIEKRYSGKVKYDLDDEVPSFTKEISNFELDCKEDNDASLKYLYSYLCLLSQYDDEKNNILGRPSSINSDQLISSRLSFMINKRYEANLMELTNRLNVHADFLRDKEGANITRLFVDVLLADDLNILDPQKYKIYFGCRPGILSLILQNIIDTYKPTEFPTVLQNSGLFFDYKFKVIKRGAVYTAQARLHKKPSSELNRKVNRIFTECSPAK